MDSTRPWPLNRSDRYARYCEPPTGPVGPGHLRTLLSIHATLCGDGVVTAHHRLTDAQVARGVDACRYFQLDALAELLKVMPAAASSPGSAAQFDAECHRRYTGSQTLADAIRRKVSQCPQDFPALPG